MVSLYVCDMPQTVDKQDLVEIYGRYGGFVEVRIARDRNRYVFFKLLADFIWNRQKIAFVDFREEEMARLAMNNTRGFRFPNSSKGLSKLVNFGLLIVFFTAVRFSDNSKMGSNKGPI